MKIEETQELSMRAVACKGWRWLPGMADTWGGRVREGDGIDRIKALPNLNDPATLGCLLQLVREANSDQCACVFPIDYGPAGVMWQVRLTANGRQVTDRHYTTEAGALVAALEAVQ